MPDETQKPVLNWEMIRQHVRKRPGMYFGAGGPRAIPIAIDCLWDAILRHDPEYRGRIELRVAETPTRQEFTLNFEALASKVAPASDMTSWLQSAPRDWEIYALAGASRHCLIENSNGEQIAITEIGDEVPVATRIQRVAKKPFLRFTFEFDPAVFGRAGDQELYQVSSLLKTVSALRGGLATAFKADGIEASHLYREGLKSCVLEMDHTRFPLHPGCFSFAASREDMSVEGHVRFVHAGVGRVDNFVNYTPTHGGTHLEGLGKALKKLFGAAQGCRKVVLITNPDTGEQVSLPHCCIGALHVNLRDPHFAGPTKDILMGDDVREFVYETAVSQLVGQWERFEK